MLYNIIIEKKDSETMKFYSNLSLFKTAIYNLKNVYNVGKSGKYKCRPNIIFQIRKANPTGMYKNI